MSPRSAAPSSPDAATIRAARCQRARRRVRDRGVVVRAGRRRAATGWGRVRAPGGGGRRGPPVPSYGRCPVLRRGRGRRPGSASTVRNSRSRGPFDRLDRAARDGRRNPPASPAGRPRPPRWPSSSSTPARLRSAPYAGTVAALRASRSASGPSARPGAAGRRTRPPGARRAARCRGRRAPRRSPASSTGPRPPRRPGRSASRAGRADRQLQCVVQEMEAVGGRVRHGGGTEHPRLAPAVRRRSAHTCPVATRSRTVTGSGSDAEALGAYEGQAQLRQRR